ncbi:unnamed protein product [Ectocarpus sp. CCAP 1310/34]|nr:unnamed protein product [Ectocarpus sp. CCAP 1310/34]
MQKFSSKNEICGEKHGMTMEARASQARFDGLVRRADVKELTRSLVLGSWARAEAKRARWWPEHLG